METALGILGFAALFVAFGLFRPGARRGCGGECTGSCAPGSCEAAGDAEVRVLSVEGSEES